MTQLLNQTRLQEIARVIQHPNLSPRRLIPRLTWTVDAATGRPAGHWMLSADDAAPSPWEAR